MPIPIRNNDKAKAEWLKARMDEIIKQYTDLEPDDAYVHYDSVEIGMTGGGKTGGAVLDPTKLLESVDALICSGLKTLSTILGRRSTGNTESFAKIEIKLYLNGVRAIQEVIETILSRALTFYLNIQGKQGIVEFRFRPIEIRTALEQAQFEQIHLMNCQFKRDQGWIDQEEAAMLAVGHSAVAEAPISNETPTNRDGGTPQGAPDDQTPAAQDNNNNN